MLLRNQTQAILSEERDDYRFKVIPIKHLIPITILVIETRIFLEVDFATTEELLKFIKNFLILLY